MKAVITVPAYFGEKDRNETRHRRLRAVSTSSASSEPTAAALAYGRCETPMNEFLVLRSGSRNVSMSPLLQMDRGAARGHRQHARQLPRRPRFRRVFSNTPRDRLSTPGVGIPSTGKDLRLQKRRFKPNTTLSERLETEVAFTLRENTSTSPCYRKATLLLTADELYAMDAANNEGVLFRRAL